MNEKDEILKFLLKNKNKSFTQREFQKEVLTKLNQDEIKELLVLINGYKPNLIKVLKEYNSGLIMVQYSGLIDNFLDNGGFAAIEANLKEEQEYISKKEDLENQILNLKRDNLRLKNWDIRFRWLIALGSFISGFILEYFLDINI